MNSSLLRKIVIKLALISLVSITPLSANAHSGLYDKSSQGAYRIFTNSVFSCFSSEDPKQCFASYAKKYRSHYEDLKNERIKRKCERSERYRRRHPEKCEPQLADSDGDGWDDEKDVFPNDPQEWADLDLDGLGDNSDTDLDGDGVSNTLDAFPRDATESLDTDNDGIGNNSDTDIDGDGYANNQDVFPNDPSEWADIDGDGIGDVQDTDRDGDGVLNTEDAFPQDPTETSDLDNDQIGDNKDTDIDGDGIENVSDVFPLNPAESSDLDGDGVGDNSDVDIDGDGVINTSDAFPVDASEANDLDGDGIGDNSDLDRDGDGVNNDIELQAGTDPNNAASVPADFDGDGIPNELDADIDGDGVLNEDDAFPENAQESADLDQDGIGDNSDLDVDGDGVVNTEDSFPRDASESLDTDKDGVGNNKDTDMDGDGYLNDSDAFPLDATEWLDLDGDGIGNNTDADIDGDGTLNIDDAFPSDASETRDLDGDGIGDNTDTDIDGDGVDNNLDAFPLDKTEQADLDNDGIGNNSDSDIDGDGTNNDEDAFPLDATEHSDTDNDGTGDNTDADIDGDNVINEEDAFPLDATEASDLDGDGIGDNSDEDIDGDNVINEDDAFPLDATETNDLDGDGIGDTVDTDRDGDGISNTLDIFPNDPSEWLDLDGDGIGNNADADRDGDGINNDVEITLGTDPDDATSYPADLDGDGIPNDLDEDRDGDGALNSLDAFPDDATEQSDLDADGVGDNTDTDVDGDGVQNDIDAFPRDTSESSDLDGDGIGDNSDTDVDGDGVSNTLDVFPFDPSESLDLDGDGIGNNADTDKDGDGVDNTSDLFPLDSTESSDLDGDGIGDNSDADRDGDGVINLEDAFPLNPNESSDIDSDGVGDNTDTDIDGDGVENNADLFPLDSTETTDFDGDGVGDNSDTDRDGDGVENESDACANTPLAETVGANGCIIVNQDADDDGVLDSSDSCPNTEAEHAVDANGCSQAQLNVDTDGDGIIDQLDTDDDNDGYSDVMEGDEGTDPLNIESRPGSLILSVAGSLVSQTGMKTSYAPNDDGDLRSGLPRNYSRDDAVGIVTDNVNALQWHDTSETQGLSLSWRDASYHCLDSELGGITDWRLPNKYELMYLNDFNEVGKTSNQPMLDEAFLHGSNSEYWSYDYKSNDAFTVHFGVPKYQLRNKTSYSLKVRCVSGSAKPTSYALPVSDSLDSPFVVVDKYNQLMWHDTEEVQTNKLNWTDALSYCTNLTINGLDDWRLPNSHEMHSVVDELYLEYNSAFQSLPSEYGPEWWLSTGDDLYPDHAMALMASRGTYNHYSRFQAQQKYVRCVRDYQPTVVISGGDRTILEREVVTFDGSRSYSGDNTPLTNYWWYDSTTRKTLGHEPTFTSDQFSDGEHLIYLYVKDQYGVQFFHSFTLTVENVNQAPVANAGADQTTDYTTSITLDASLSTDDAGIVAYEWREGDEVLSTTESFSKNDFSEGIHTVDLTVVDAEGLTSTDSVTIEVTAYNSPPVADAGPDISVFAGVDARFDSTGSYDSDGQIASRKWYLNNTYLSRYAVFTRSFAAGTYSIRVVVTDNQGKVSEDTMTLTVFAVTDSNRPVANAGPDQSVYENEIIRIDGSASTDPDGTIISYQWVENGWLLSREMSFDFGDKPEGSYLIQLKVTDSDGLWSEDTMTVTVSPRPLGAPIANAGPDQSVYANEVIHLDGSTSSDADGSIVSYQWLDLNDTLLSTNAIYNLSGQPEGSYVLKLRVIDNDGLSSEDSLTITVLPSRQKAPVASAGPDQTLRLGDNLILDGSNSTDEDGSIVSYQWVNEDRVLVSEEARFELNSLKEGSYVFELIVTDNDNLFSVDTVNIVINPYNDLAACPVNNISDDSNFVDQYPDENIAWNGSDYLTVKAIESAFNHARKIDKSVDQYLKMPTQSVWDAFSYAEQALYLLNAERRARGLKPFTGISQEINEVAQNYSDYHLDNNVIIDHYHDATTPISRLDSNQVILNSRDRHIIPESISAAVSRKEVVDKTEALVGGIYYFIYEDKAPFGGKDWGHRDHLLQTSLNENTGEQTNEGLIGIGVSNGVYDPFNENTTPPTQGAVFVINTIDPSPNYDLSTVTTVDTNQAQLCNDLISIELDESSIDTNKLVGISIESSDLILLLNDSISLQVMASYQDGSQIDISSFVSFAADNRSIVSIQGGELQAINPGVTSIQAMSNGVVSNAVQISVGAVTDTANLIGTQSEQLVPYIPPNATAEAYDAKSLAVYTGSVLDRDGIALPDVQISLVNQPEYGSVLTDENGQFILAAPAGLQALVYEKANHLTVQREAIGPSNSWVTIEDVTLLEFDIKKSFIDFRNGEIQVHESTVITDEFGSRKATVVFNNINSATVQSANGYERNLDNFWLSATEFETPESMPGPLPKNSAFTYCTELHVEGTRYNDTVVFDNDVVMFVDNFLGFEVGEIIPIGYFDTIESNWVASKNGVVVRLLDEDNDGLVDGLDYNSDGIADDLNENGNTADDALGLDAYSAGDTLWWGAFNHFTATDYNFDALKKEFDRLLEMLRDLEDPNNDELTCTGSYVMPHQQSFHEDIEIAGTDLTLHYSSQRTADYKHKVDVKVSGDTISNDVTSMIARLEIAGQVFEQTFAPQTNLSAQFIWDGLNLGGTRPQGVISGLIRIGFAYDTNYASTGNAASDGKPLAERVPAWNEPGDSDTGIKSRQSDISWQTSGISFKNSFDAQLAQGWSLSNVHEYDAKGLIYKGDGTIEDVTPQSLVLKTGQTYSLVDGDDGYYQRGGKNIDYEITYNNLLLDKVTKLEWLNPVEPVRVNSKSQAINYCKTEAEPLGSDWRLPTTKERAYIAAKSASFAGPAIFNMNSSVWTTTSLDGDYHDVYCVRGTSINETYVENLKSDSENAIVIDSDNGLMWQDSSENVSLTLAWESSIEYCENLEHASFTDWRLPNINELLYVLPNDVFANQTELDSGNNTPWDASVDFKQPYWASTTNYFNDDHAWAIESISYNSMHFSKQETFNVRCVREDTSNSRMPYRFNEKGQHLSTIDVDSGKTLYTLNYNGDERLESIVDQFGNTITLSRDAVGRVNSIIAPDGQATTLDVNNNLNLNSVSYEDNSQYQFYYDGSLLTEKSDPNGNSFPHVFDENGRVTQTSDDEGGQWDFFDEKLNYKTNRYGFSTAEGNSYETIRKILESGDVQKTTTAKDGSVTVNTLQADQLKETIVSNGVTTVIDNVLDDKTQQEIPSRIMVTMPSGLVSTSTMDKVYGANGADFSQYTLGLSTNGRISTILSDSKTGLYRVTSPEGRLSTSHTDPVTLLLQRIESSGLTDTTYSYDSRGRTSTITTDERTTTYSYDDSSDLGNVSSITAANNQTTYFDYDVLGRITKTIYPDGHETQTSYDNNGNATTLVIPTPAEHDFTFTGVNKVKSKTTPLNEVTRYNYDADRRLTNVTLPSGKQISNVYSAGKLQKTITPEHETIYAYVNGNQLKTITQNAESLSYQYDGDLVTGIDYAGVLDAGIAQGYDANFWMNSLSYAGASTAISYDNDGLLTGINGYAITRHAQHGLPTQLTDNKLAQTFSYNGYGESNVVTNKVNSKRTYDYELSYNLIGQITGKTETLSDGTVNNFEYGYDQRNRLISVKQNNNVVESYGYDANGNRLTQSNSLRDIQNQTSTYNLGDQITSDGQSSFEYDGDGRLSKKTTGGLVEEYSYSSEGKLLEVVFKENALITKSISYQHNALGNRVAKLVDNVIIEKYLWLNKTTLLATYDKDDNLKQRFEYGLSHTPVSFTQAGSKYYITSDHLGSPRIITDESGSIIKTLDYDSFGNVISDSNEDFEIPFGFAGGLKDSDTKLLRFGYRDYDASIGRWTARDPIGFAGGDTNLYGYVANDPIDFLDLTGLISQNEANAIGAFIGGGIGGLINGAIAGAIAGGVTGGPGGAVLGAIGGAAYGAAVGASAGLVGASFDAALGAGGSMVPALLGGPLGVLGAGASTTLGSTPVAGAGVMGAIVGGGIGGLAAVPGAPYGAIGGFAGGAAGGLIADALCTLSPACRAEREKIKCD